MSRDRSGNGSYEPCSDWRDQVWRLQARERYRVYVAITNNEQQTEGTATLHPARVRQLLRAQRAEVQRPIGDLSAPAGDLRHPPRRPRTL